MYRDSPRVVKFDYGELVLGSRSRCLKKVVKRDSKNDPIAMLV